jgi:hypothetical protein
VDLVRVASVCSLLGCTVAQAYAEPATSPDKVYAAGSNGELTTRAGNRLQGELVRLDCHGLLINYLGNSVVVPLDAIATASSVTNVPVFPGTGGDRVNGKVLVRAGVVTVKTRELGKLRLPVAAIRCAPDRAGPILAANQRHEGPRLDDAQMARVSGTGPGPGDAKADTAATTDAVAAPTNSQQPAGQTAKPANDAAAPGAQSTTGSATDQKKPPTPKEQSEESERNTLEFLRNEAVLAQPQKIETDFGIGYLHTSQVLGNQKLLTGIGAVRYGISRGLEGFIAVPLVYGQRQNFGGINISKEIAGISDVKFGLKYNLINEDVGIPAVVLGITGTAPTGRNPYLPGSQAAAAVAQAQGGDTRDPLNPQSGTGHWQVTGSTTALKSFDPIVLFGTINYTHFIPATYGGTHIVPGDIFELNTGFGFAVNDRGTFSSQIFIDYAKPWSFNGVQVAQTGKTPISLRFAYTHVLGPDDLIEPSVIFGLTRDATDAVVAVDWIHRW